MENTLTSKSKVLKEMPLIKQLLLINLFLGSFIKFSGKNNIKKYI